MTATVIDIAERNKTLVEQLLAGDAVARDELIEINRRLVFTTVRRFLRAWPDFKYLRADLIGAGVVALIQAVDRLIEIGEVKRPIRNYLITSIRFKLLTEVEREIEHLQSHQYIGFTYGEVPEHNLAVDDPIFSQIEDQEFLLSLCESDRDREILTLFLGGKSPSDIIRSTDYTESIVWKTLGLIRGKLPNFQESMSELGSI